MFVAIFERGTNFETPILMMIHVLLPFRVDLVRRGKVHVFGPKQANVTRALLHGLGPCDFYLGKKAEITQTLKSGSSAGFVFSPLRSGIGTTE